MIKRKQQGIMIMELMIGLLIGLLTTLAITVVLSVSEGQRRATMAGEDAQVSGALALHALQRDIRHAGYGLVANPAGLGCPINNQAVGGVAPPTVLAPVTITQNATAGLADTIRIFSSSKRGVSVPVFITENHGPGLTTFTVRSSFSVAANDWLLVIPEVWATATNQCTLFRATSVNSTAGVPWTVVNHADLTAYPPQPAAGYPAKSFLVNLGSTVSFRTYSISANNVLQVTDFPSATANDVFPEIVNLRAFYGKDTDGNGAIDTYDATTPTTAAGWRQILGVRVALVARSTQYEKETVTTAGNVEWDVGTAISITGTVSCSSGSGGQCLRIKVDHLTDWQHYRYKVFDTLIPLRNVLWNS
ncbi:MAG: PilW family protein [Azonexus sp.]|nr:PilW family protein [Azonexus sp.]